MKKIILAVIAVFLLGSYVCADYKSDVENGVKAYNNEDYQKAYKYFQSAYEEKPTENLANYMKLAKEKFQVSTDSLLEDAGVISSYGGWATEENLVTINPCFFYYGTIELYYERKVVDNISFGINAGYSPTGNSWSGDLSKAYGFSVGACINMFPEAKALNGWFVGPEFHYFRFKSERDGYYYGTDIINQYISTYGMHGGYRWILPSRFIVDLSFAFIMAISGTRTDSEDPYEGGTTFRNYFMPTMGCNIGTAF